MKYKNIREEELKNKVGQDFFADFDTTKIVGNIDFCVALKNKKVKQTLLFENESLLWAEAKRGTYDLYTMFAQLVLTIGKARTYDKFLPPSFLGAFDSQKIAFVSYNSIMDVFSMNDFNWNVTPSNHETKEFKIIKECIEKALQQNHYLYDFQKNESELHFFVKNNIAKATEAGKITIDKNNFVPIYLRWLDQVKPAINFDWLEGRKQNILDSDFYLADLFVDDKGTSAIDDDTPLSDNLFVVFRNSHYEIAKENLKSLFNATIDFNDKNIYEQFWKKYKRPPLEEFQRLILDRRDLLVPQDVRERKGAFFTPKKWVELSQRYITDVLGEDWQEEYYVWDCAAGTGNLLAGLTNKYNVWASTLDQADINVMHERIKNGALLLKDHVFQFDFLNDDFSKLPPALQDIINNEEKRKKLVIYINPPYAEVSSIGEKGKAGVNKSKMHDKYSQEIGTAGREIYILFFVKIYKEINDCFIAEFSKLKTLQGSAFSDYRALFKAQLLKSFVVPAWTFDNVKGNFPIGFKIWDTKNNVVFAKTSSDVYNENGDFVGVKSFSLTEKGNFINKWINLFKIDSDKIGFLAGTNGNDFQQNGIVYILNAKSQMANPRGIWIGKKNLMETSIYFAIRKSIDQTWLNDRDQFLYPNEGWKSDFQFQNDCLAFTLFSTNIQSKYGPNHWIPFTEQQVNSREKFESNFMTQFIKGKTKPDSNAFDVGNQASLFGQEVTEIRTQPLLFSEEATAVFDAARDLWSYYHLRKNVNANASLYDIREHFQGRNEKGKMNNKSQDEIYMKLIGILRENLKILTKKIEPKVYEYEFLKD